MFVFAGHAVGQVGGTHRFTHIDFDDGLPATYVTSIYQRPDGFVWIGTDSGAVRYDGHDMLHLQYKSDDAASLSNSWIRGFETDPEGRLWIGTDYGLNRQHANQTSFTRYLPVPGDESSLPGAKILGLRTDRQGTLWAGTEGGLARYLPDSDRFRRYVPPSTPDDPLRRAVRALLEDSQGRFWVGTHRGLLLLDRESAAFSAPHAGDARIDGLLENGYFARVIEDSRGTVWFAIDGDGGLLGLHADGRWQLFRHDPADPRSLQTNSIWSLAEDQRQRLWVGTWGEGLALLDAEQRGFTRYRANETDEFSLPSDTVNDIRVDSSGTVWLATGTAAAVVNPTSETIRQFTQVVGDPASLPNRQVWTLSAATDGSVWVGTERGLARLMPDGEHIQAWPAIKDGVLDEGDGTIWALVPDEQGGAWLGTDMGLDHFDPQVPVTQHLHGATGTDAVIAQAVYAIARMPNGDLWAAEQGVGLHRFDAAGKLQESLPAHQGLPAHPTRAWVQGPDMVWFGSNTGLFWFRPSEHRFGVVTQGPDIGLLRGEQINGLTWDAEREVLWIATDDQGIFGLDPGASAEQATVRVRIRPSDGLPNPRVYAMLPDARGNLWLTTQAGLSRYSLDDHRWQHFGAINERRKIKFLENSAARSRDGALLFGGTRGFIRLDPAVIRESGFQPALRITSAVVEEPGHQRRFDALVPGSLDVGYDFLALELHVAALDYAAPERNIYRYRVEGRDEDWVELGTDHRFVLRDLGPGRYRLVVQGANRDGVWSPHEAVMTLNVTPPAWRSTSAYAAYAVAAALLLLGMYRVWRRRQDGIARIAASEQRLSGALWGSGDELWDWDLGTGEVARSNLLATLPAPGPGSRGTLDSLLGAVHPDDLSELQAALDRIAQGTRDEFEAIYRLPDRDGGWSWVLDRGKVSERGADGRARRIVGTLRNVDAIMRTEEQLSLVAAALRQSRDGALIMDREYKLVFANSAAERYLALPADTLLGQPLGVGCLRLLDPEQDNEQVARFAISLRAGESVEGELEFGLADGTHVPVAVSVNPVRDPRGEITHCVAFLADITFRRESQEKLQRMAQYDALTGLPNRRLFIDRFTHALAQARRDGTRVALLFIDLDHFKHVNDSLGHAAGDELLRNVAARLRSSTRDADTVARLGGDEFTVIVEHASDEAAIALVAHKLIEALLRDFLVAGQRVHVSPSIGIAIYPEDGSTADELLMHSDIAMYHAKDEGRNNFQYYRPEMNVRVRERIALEEKLREALAGNRLELFYQPKLCTQTGRVQGLEALLRWNDPEAGAIPPARFIPVAEESGLIVELGQWVLRRACDQAMQWLSRGLDPGSVAVNLSARQFRDRDLMEDIRAALSQSGLAPERLELEITESTLVNDMDYAVSTLKRLRELGVRLALDDFGTGYSSLSHLRRFPIHTLKLDRSFLRDVPGDEQDSRLVAALVNLAHDLGVSVTAEGIESREQWEFLRNCRCEEVQGFLFARPLPVAEIEQMLAGARAQGVAEG